MASDASQLKDSQKAQRTGGRSAAVLAAVHEAAIALLGEVGYDALQLPEVAARAGVNKTTVYRRWPSKTHLVLDLMSALAARQVSGRDTGSLVGDLVALLEDLTVTLQSRVAQALLAASTGGSFDAQAQAARVAFFNERFQRSGVIIERAIARGELPAGTDARLVLEDACSPIYFRLFVSGDPVTGTEIRRYAERAAWRAQG